VNIKNEDLIFLIELEDYFGKIEGWTDRTEKLWSLNERLIQQRNTQREKTRIIISERRIHNKNYGRSKSKKKQS